MEDEGGVVVGGAELGAWEPEAADGLDDEPDDDVPFEHPAATIAMATTPAILVRSSRIGGSSVPRMAFAECTLPATGIPPARF
ncbi:hypothetical protein A5756_06375 [Mycobacterium sp. 852002-53434_SCH5985345]|nr:hypothetical protein A5756_06375 [Mycobacterium sp. 852002-53434_SCH5985345]OBF78400.1 hypothetical protein A5750_03880 [Mycobacterium sp. 852002-51613_SCH5001154]OBF97635.1 hypothetical protein A5773_10665 [Mycobacterium sp. 852014-52450_SCH5900713]